MEHVRASAVLTLAGAGAALDAALAHATEHDLRMNVAVVDPGGVLLSFARMDDAFAASGEIAVDKARTVVRFGGAPTAGLYEALAGEDAVIRGIGNRRRCADPGRRAARRGDRCLRRVRGGGCPGRRCGCCGCHGEPVVTVGYDDHLSRCVG